MNDPERSAETKFSLDERLLVWLNRVNGHLESGQPNDNQPTEVLLTQGYQLFFEILEPLKETEWIQAEHPDIGYGVWLEPGHDSRLSEFAEVFGNRYDCWGVEIYSLNRQRYGDERQASIRLRCARQSLHGEKILRVFLYEPPKSGYSTPQGQMYIEDKTASWLRTGAEGKLETSREKNLYDYPGLSLCKLAVVLADSFAAAYPEEPESKLVCLNPAYKESQS